MTRKAANQTSFFDLGPEPITKRALAKAERARKAAEKTAPRMEADHARIAAHQRIKAAYIRVFAEVRGVEPRWSGVEGRAANRLLADFGADEHRVIKLLVDVFTSPFWSTRTGVSILSIAADPSKYERGALRDRTESGHHRQPAALGASAAGLVPVNGIGDL